MKNASQIDTSGITFNEFMKKMKKIRKKFIIFFSSIIIFL